MDWYVPKSSVKIGYEISIIRCFYSRSLYTSTDGNTAGVGDRGLMDEITGDDGSVSA